MSDNKTAGDTDSSPPDVANTEPEPRPLRLDQFLKLCGVVETGGQAKQLIQDGEVLLNGEVETRRRKKLSIDDVIQIADGVLPVKEFFTAG